MTKRFNVRWLWFLLPALILLSCIPCSFMPTEPEKSFRDVTPEEVFEEYIWTKGIIPTEVSNINGVEGAEPFSSTGPAFVRFGASPKFIDELVETKFSWYEEYSLVPCRFMFNSLKPQALYRDYPKELTWWHPEEIILPMCYKAQGLQGDDFRYLLIGLEDETVYFYQNASCGACPD
ncbi:MAG: hypothetical protein GY797_29495 [Deltaproteobacteria bacterium]|nr:hypothetical protein [Deltaproteobacteria bacterium]